MAIKIIPQQETPEESRWLSLLLGLAVLFLLFTLVAYLFLLFSLRSTRQTLEELDQELALGLTPEEEALEEEVVGYSQKIEELSLLLASHQETTNLLGILEDSAHPRVFLSKLRLDTKAYKVELEGESESFLALNQQQVLWQQNPFIREVNVARASLAEGGKVSFALSLDLSPETFAP